MALPQVSMPSRRQSPPSCPPRYRVAQERGSGDLADEIATVADLIGYPQLDWQRDVTRVWSTYDEDGQWVHRRNGASVPRQAGKSVDGIVWATTLTALLGYSVLWTDHNYSTTCEMLKRFQRIFGRKPGDPWGIADFNKLVRRFNSKTAQEAFELTNGGVLAFSTRTKSAALGYSFDVVFYDEAQELTGEHMQAITPTTAAGPHHNTQDVYLGTPTRAGSSATKFRELRDEAIGDAPGDDVSWFEWGVEEVGDVNDERRWYLVNPSLGPGRADINAIRKGIRSLGKTDELAAAQEYLGYWLPQAKADPAIPRGEWEACATQAPPAPDPAGEVVSYGVKYSPDGRRVALCACAARRGGAAHVELVCEGDAHRWTPLIAERAASHAGSVAEVLVDGKSGASSLVDELDARRFPRRARRAASPSEVADAFALFTAAVANQQLTHWDDPGQGALDESATGSTRRKVGRDGSGFDGPTCHVAEAASLALLSARTTRRRPGRGCVMI